MYLIRYVVSSCLKRGLFEFMVRSNLPYVEHDVCTKRSTCSDDRSRIFFLPALRLLVGPLSIPTSTSSSRESKY